MSVKANKSRRSFLIPLCLLASAGFALIAINATVVVPGNERKASAQTAVAKGQEPTFEFYTPDIADFHGTCMKTTNLSRTGVEKVTYGPGTFPMTQDELTWCVDPKPKPEGAGTITVKTNDPSDPLEAADATILKERADAGQSTQPATN